jgi:hypothetical protein
VNAALAMNTSKMSRPASRRNRVFTPQITDADSVYNPAIIKYVRITPWDVTEIASTAATYSSAEQRPADPSTAKGHPKVRTHEQPDPPQNAGLGDQNNDALPNVNPPRSGREDGLWVHRMYVGAERNTTVFGAGRVSTKRHPAIGANVESESSGAAPADQAWVTSSVQITAVTAVVANAATVRIRIVPSTRNSLH